METITVPGDGDGVVVHAELRWPEGGGVMLGTADRADSEFSQLPTSCASVYVVTDDPHTVYKKAVAAGAKSSARCATRTTARPGSASPTRRATCGASARIAASPDV